MRDRALVVTAAVALGLAAFVSLRTPERAQPGFHTWLSEDLGLGPAVVRCIDAKVDDGLLRGVDPDELTSARLRSDGLAAVPAAQRSLVGDVLIGCSVSPSTAAGP